MRVLYLLYESSTWGLATSAAIFGTGEDAVSLGGSPVSATVATLLAGTGLEVEAGAGGGGQSVRW